MVKFRCFGAFGRVRGQSPRSAEQGECRVASVILIASATPIPTLTVSHPPYYTIPPALNPFEETYALVLQLCALHSHAAEAVGVLEELPVDKQLVPWVALCTALFAVDAEGERGYSLLEDGEARGLEAPPALQEEALCFLCARSWREEVARRWDLLVVSGAGPVCHGASVFELLSVSFHAVSTPSPF